MSRWTTFVSSCGAQGPPPLSGRVLLPAALSALALALACGCARVGPPGGGPEDTTPPTVVSAEPADGTTEVAPDTDIRIAFSEDMDRVGVERAFSVTPEIDLKNLRWDGNTLVARPESDLPESTTVTVTVAETADDYHGVQMEAPFTAVFSTGPTIDTGTISGRVTQSGEPVRGATVWACLRGLATESGAIRPCSHEATTDEDGDFRIYGVAASERPYTLVAFVDADEDGVYSVFDEEGIIADSSAIVSEPGAAAEGIVIELPADPESEPASVR